MPFNLPFTSLSKLLILFLIRFAIGLYEIPKSELNHRPSGLVSVDTRLGTVIGYEQEVLNRTINVFYGLPYAEPPIGKLRFKKTQPIKKFPNDPYSALSFKPHCRIRNLRNYHPNDNFSEVSPSSLSNFFILINLRLTYDHRTVCTLTYGRPNWQTPKTKKLARNDTRWSSISMAVSAYWLSNAG